MQRANKVAWMHRREERDSEQVEKAENIRVVNGHERDAYRGPGRSSCVMIIRRMN